MKTLIDKSSEQKATRHSWHFFKSAYNREKIGQSSDYLEQTINHHKQRLNDQEVGEAP